MASAYCAMSIASPLGPFRRMHSGPPPARICEVGTKSVRSAARNAIEDRMGPPGDLEVLDGVEGGRFHNLDLHSLRRSEFDVRRSEFGVRLNSELKTNAERRTSN